MGDQFFAKPPGLPDLQNAFDKMVAIMDEHGRQGEPIDPPLYLTVNTAVWEQMSKLPNAFSVLHPKDGPSTCFGIAVKHNAYLGDRIAALMLHTSGATTIWKLSADGKAWEVHKGPTFPTPGKPMRYHGTEKCGHECGTVVCTRHKGHQGLHEGFSTEINSVFTWDNLDGS